MNELLSNVNQKAQRARNKGVKGEGKSRDLL